MSYHSVLPICKKKGIISSREAKLLNKKLREKGMPSSDVQDKEVWNEYYQDLLEARLLRDKLS